MSLTAESEIEELRRALTDTQRKLGVMRAKTQTYVDALKEAATEAYLALGPAKIPTVPRDRRRKTGQVALLHTTDWQGGKETSSYNLGVMDKRLAEMCDLVEKWTEVLRADHPIPTCTVLFGGDMVEGVDIFPHQAWEVEAPLYEQLFHVAGAMETLVLRLLGTFERVDVVAEWGNHGRIGGKGANIRASDNMDRILYGMVEDRLRRSGADEKRLTWSCSSRWYQPVTIGNYRAMLIHGDEIRGFGGNTPAYALVRKGNAWASGAVDFNFRDIYVGHYHNANSYSLAADGTVYMTGSTESDNEYAREFVAASSSPSQRLHFVHPENGIVTSEHKLWLR